MGGWVASTPPCARRTQAGSTLHSTHTRTREQHQVSLLTQLTEGRKARGQIKAQARLLERPDMLVLLKVGVGVRVAPALVHGDDGMPAPHSPSPRQSIGQSTHTT